ncbi:MAG: tetratricopeptide repeat protein [Labilithrix sp.]|nr:tetratricopeptide repeat protein [Labilithrix sp.]MCW5817556.1 tetratricopeptide repeat protein [Labilithrix sp.]
MAAWFALASALSDTTRYEEAADAWTRAAALAPVDHRASAHYNAGNGWLAAGRPDAAVEAYRAALAAGFDEVGVLHGWALAHARAAGRAAARGDDLRAVDDAAAAIVGGAAAAIIDDAAAAIVDDAAAASVGGADGWALLGTWRAEVMGDRRRAVPAFEQAIALDAEAGDGEWWLELARCRVALGEPAAASTASDRARELDHPGWFDVDVAVASTRGDAETLLARWGAQLALPGRSAASVRLLSALGRDEAARELAAARLDDPSTPQAERIELSEALAETALTRGDPSAALDALDRGGSERDASAVLRARALVEVGRADAVDAVLARWENAGATAPPAVRMVRAMAAAARGHAVEPTALDVIDPRPSWFRLPGK